MVPVITVSARRASIGQLLKLWGGTLAANLVGGWAIMWVIMAGLPPAARTDGHVRHPLRHRTAVAARRSAWPCSPAR